LKGAIVLQVAYMQFFILRVFKI